jgi:hypothetical protein
MVEWSIDFQTFSVSPLNPPIPDDIASLPAGALLSQVAGDASLDDWPAGFFEDSCGFLTEDMEEPSDTAPDPVEAVEIP